MRMAAIGLLLVCACEPAHHAMSPTELGLLIRERGCEKADAAVAREADPDFFIGMMYEIGKCRSQDFGKALDHYRTSAQRGNDEAMYSFFVTAGRTDISWTERERKAHWPEAMQFLQRAAELGNQRAVKALSAMHDFRKPNEAVQPTPKGAADR